MESETPQPFFALDPVELDIAFGAPRRQDRATVVFRPLLVLPHLVVLVVLTLVAGALAIVGWFAALILGRLPRWIAAYELSVIAYSIRVDAYAFWLAGEFPSFSLSRSHADYPVSVRIGASRLSRLKVFFRWLLFIPAAIVSGIAHNGLLVLSPVIWLVTLVRGETPQTIFSAAAAVIRYQARLNAYMGLVTDVYPRRLFGDEESVWTPAEADAGRDYRVRLSKGAHRLMVLIIVLGIAAAIGNIVLQVRSEGPAFSLAVAEQDLESASQTFATSFAACAGIRYPLNCEESSELAWSEAFDQFGSSLSQISFSGSNEAAAAALERQAHTVARALRRAGQAETVGANQRAFLQAQIELNRFDADARSLFGQPR